MPKFTLSKPKFKKWLQTTDRTFVGVSQTARCCPIATFIKDVYGHSPVIAKFDFTLSLAESSIDLPLPVWAKGFIQRVDLQGRYERITRLKALELL